MVGCWIRDFSSQSISSTNLKKSSRLNSITLFFSGSHLHGTKNGRKANLVNQPYDGADSFTTYHIDQYFPEIDFLGFEVGYYEAMEYKMVNVQTGDVFALLTGPRHATG